MCNKIKIMRYGKIDLMKCKGLGFKANIRGMSCEGRIQVEHSNVYLCQNIMNGAICRDSLGYCYAWCINDGSEKAMKKNLVTDLEIIPRDPETYRDWQVGDRVCDNKHRNASREVIFRSGELVVMKTAANTACSNYTCDELFGCGYRLVLTDIERQIIEEKKKSEYEPQDGAVAGIDPSAYDRIRSNAYEVLRFVMLLYTRTSGNIKATEALEKSIRRMAGNGMFTDEEISEIKMR